MPRQPLQRPLSPPARTSSAVVSRAPHSPGCDPGDTGQGSLGRGCRAHPWGHGGQDAAGLGGDAKQTDQPAWGHSSVRGQPPMPRTAPLPPGGCDSPSAALCSCWAPVLFSKSPPGPRGPPVSPPAAHRAWPCAGPAPGPRDPRGSGAGLGGPRGVPRAGVPPRCGRGGDGKLRSSRLAGCRPRMGLPWGAGGFHSAHPKTFCFFFYFAFLIVISCGENPFLGSIPSAGGLAAANVDRKSVV